MTGASQTPRMDERGWRRVLARLAPTLSGGRWSLWSALLATLVCLPTLGTAISTDDHFHKVALSGEEPELSRRAWDVFSLAPSPESSVLAARELGVLPWWVPEGASLRVLRPLASWTHALDHGLLGGVPWLMHAQNLLWYAALVLAVGWLHRRVMTSPSPASKGGEGGGGERDAADASWRRWPLWVSGLATFFYAMDDGHGQAIGWIANRHALMASTLAVLALVAHDRWRREGRWSAAVASWAAFAVALGCSEAAVGALSYGVAYAVCLDPEPRLSRRALTVAPMVALVGAWRVLVEWLGYGNNGAGLFLDPLDAPWRFLVSAPSRASALIFGQWGWVPSDLWVAVPEERGLWVVIAGAGAFVALIGWVYAPMLARDRSARFWTLGAVGALLPLCATFPMDRLLLLVGVGASAMIAQVIGAVALMRPGLPESPRWRRRAGALAVSWLVIHGALGPALLPLRALTQTMLTPSFEKLSDHLPDEPGLRDQTLVVLHAADFWSAGLTPVVRRSRGQAAPARVRVLAAGFEGLSVHRPALPPPDCPHALELTRPEGLFTDPMERLFYGDHRDRPVGSRLVLGDMTVVLMARRADDGRPTQARFCFAKPLGDASWRWVAWSGGGYAPYSVPAPGETEARPAVDIEAVFAPADPQGR